VKRRALLLLSALFAACGGGDLDREEAQAKGGTKGKPPAPPPPPPAPPPPPPPPTVWAPVVPVLLPAATFDLATTLPAELTRGGTFGVHSGSLPSGSTLTAAGIIQAGDADGSSTVVFRYRMATATTDTYSAPTGVTVRAGVGATTPAWLEGVAVNQWVQISGSAMSSTPPTVVTGGSHQKYKVNAWNGMSIDTRTNTLWQLATGGHGDWHGNEVMKLPLNDDAPAWIEQYRASSSGNFIAEVAHYADGHPTSTHTYYSQQFIEARDRAMRFGVGGSAGPSAATYANVDGFDSTVAQGVDGWDSANTWTAVPAISSPIISSCKDASTENVYWFRTNAAIY
jgi:hypothetical protein